PGCGRHEIVRDHTVGPRADGRSPGWQTSVHLNSMVRYATPPELEASRCPQLVVPDPRHQPDIDTKVLQMVSDICGRAAQQPLTARKNVPEQLAHARHCETHAFRYHFLRRMLAASAPSRSTRAHRWRPTRGGQAGRRTRSPCRMASTGTPES